MKEITLSGTVTSGGGDGKKYLTLPWVNQQIEQKLGFTPYPGTLNLTLTQESTKRKKLLKKAPSKKVCPAEGYCSGLLFKARIGKLECAIVASEVAGYPEALLEIIAPLYLRGTLQLEEGSEVMVTVNF